MYVQSLVHSTLTVISLSFIMRHNYAAGGIYSCPNSQAASSQGHAIVGHSSPSQPWVLFVVIMLLKALLSIPL